MFVAKIVSKSKEVFINVTSLVSKTILYFKLKEPAGLSLPPQSIFSSCRHRRSLKYKLKQVF